MNNLINIFQSYIHYLIHPFKTHEMFLTPARFEGYKPIRLDVYESLATSWVFILIHALFRIITLNFIILFLVDLFQSSLGEYSSFINIDQFPSLYFIVLSSILDIIFYPLFGFFMIQFWEFIFKFYANLLEVEDNVDQRIQDILSVYFSSTILNLIPIFGAPLQSMASMVLMYAGLRKQLDSSPVLSVCIILTPFLILFVLASIIGLMLLFLTQ